MKAKFKVWDINNKKFADEREFLIDCKGQLCTTTVRGQLYIVNHINFIPVFSTTKEDKNGVELFDGDLIDQCQKEFPGEHYIKEIIFAGGAWRTRSIREKQENEHPELLRLLCEHIRLSYVKIGTKFENPELMERDENTNRL